MELLKKLEKEKVINPPAWLSDNVHYATIMGSLAYGVSSDASDTDVYGFCIPKKDMVFPHLAGEIQGFGRQNKRFEQWQEHHCFSKAFNKEYDFSVYSIVKYFHLCMENNPNMIDSLFTPRRCVMHSTAIGEMVRENRKLFLHKGAWHKFKGYAYSQMHKMRIKNPDPKSKRYESVMEHGYDVKFAYHVVRLLDEVEQILSLGDVNLERDRERLKSIRRGEWSLDEIETFFDSKERDLEKLYADSTLQHKPDEDKIKTLLFNCLEHHFGDISTAISIPEKERQALEEIARICRAVGV